MAADNETRNLAAILGAMFDRLAIRSLHLTAAELHANRDGLAISRHPNGDVTLHRVDLRVTPAPKADSDEEP